MTPWRRCAVVMAGVATLAGCAAMSASHAGDAWIGAWGFPATAFPQPPAAGSSAAAAANAANAPPPNFAGVTVRQIVRVSAPAARVRIRFSNEFGLTPMRLGAVHIAQQAADGSIVPGSDHVVTFSGQNTVTIPAGAPLLSDPIEWRLPSLTRLAVSIFLPEETIPPAHRVSEYVSASGNFAGAEQLPGEALVRSGALVSGIEIVSASATHVVVTFGDSITEGFGSTANEFRGWSDRLAERLAARPAGNPATRGWSVVNAGINSNRLLHNNPGAAALARFDRDVLSVPGVAAVIVLEGINDIGYSHTIPAEAVTAGEIIDAYVQIIARAHEHGIAVFGGTITPFEDSHYYAPQGEQVRQSVNQWIRSSGAFDGVVDFDAALRDPAHPSRVAPSLERGDHLHPNDQGYAAMAAAIDLKLLTSAPRR